MARAFVFIAWHNYNLITCYAYIGTDFKIAHNAATYAHHTSDFYS